MELIRVIREMELGKRTARLSLLRAAEGEKDARAFNGLYIDCVTRAVEAYMRGAGRRIERIELHCEAKLSGQTLALLFTLDCDGRISRFVRLNERLVPKGAGRALKRSLVLGVTHLCKRAVLLGESLYPNALRLCKSSFGKACFYPDGKDSWTVIYPAGVLCDGERAFRIRGIISAD